jgi:hypothetical protein
MGKLAALFQIVLGIFLSYIGIPTQSQILVYLCTQEAAIGWISMDFCMLSKYLLFVLGILAILSGLIKLLAPEKKSK